MHAGPMSGRRPNPFAGQIPGFSFVEFSFGCISSFINCCLGFMCCHLVVIVVILLIAA